MLADLNAVTERAILPAVRSALLDVSRVSSTVRADAAKRREPKAVTPPAVIGEAIDKAQADFWVKWNRKKIAAMIRPVAEDVAKFQAGGMNAQMKPLVGIDVVGSEPWIGKAVDEFTTENVALIKSIPSVYFNQVEAIASRETADGARWEDIAPMLKERFKVSESRAKLIARDQVGKFYGDLNRVRQTDLGVESFTWRAVRDNRVREEHETRDGQVYKWASPPEGETPGEPVNCRCYADPVIAGE
jgi:SPP1 gp7 family putative phage head morphogenesis protein